MAVFGKGIQVGVSALAVQDQSKKGPGFVSVQTARLFGKKRKKLTTVAQESEISRVPWKTRSTHFTAWSEFRWGAEQN